METSVPTSPVKLQEQPFQALLTLLERPREVLTREELQKRLWPADTVVDFDRGLNNLPQPETAPVQRRRWLAIAGGLIVVTLLLVGYRLLPPPSRQIESIAVLPLENLSGNPAKEYFSDGMTDELIGEIARIGSLRVISRTSNGGARKSLPAEHMLVESGPWPLLGLPPVWYKSAAYRSRAVIDPPGVLREKLSEAELAALVTRDAMVVVTKAPSAGEKT